LPRRDLERRLKTFLYRVEDLAQEESGHSARVEAQHVDSPTP
jgi:hypothetical protein